MNRLTSQSARDLFVFALLVSIGVVGRLVQPVWEFTPIAAATIFAGFYFSRLSVAALVPLAILGISDLWLSAYNSVGVMLIKYAAMVTPVLFGRLLRDPGNHLQAAWRLGVCGLFPATIFFITTNFAVWLFQSDYPKTLAGLAQCYAAAVPFFRSMLAGDLFYLSVLFGCWAMAGQNFRREKRAEERVRKQ